MEEPQRRRRPLHQGRQVGQTSRPPRLKPIRRAAVIGAGVMGSGIAAHFANAGLEVLLLDIVPPGLSDEEKKNPSKRNGFSAGGLEKALKARPAAFFHKENARLVTVGN